MIRQNLHTHSVYDDGKDTIDEMVQAAIEKGFSCLGFSGHGWNPHDDGSMTPEKTERYIADVLDARKNAPDSLRILLGIEEDSISPVDESLFDYVIGSVHYLEKNGCLYSIDYSRKQFDRMLQEGWNGDICALCEDYYQAVGNLADNPRADIIGHFDLIAKYNEGEPYFSFDDPRILRQAKKAVERICAAGKIFEMNTGAIARGYRSEAYPSQPVLDLIFQAGGKLMINTDCHNRDCLDLGIEACLRRAEETGFQELWTYEGGTFVPRPIDAFQRSEPARKLTETESAPGKSEDI